ncbi:PIN domain-containing protein [bacterium 1xD8-6]|nr:PIN domain-containing protein [bacterium D16-36]RKI70445.1 PIN domain-containing protein [bacterium 1xD8-6]
MIECKKVFLDTTPIIYFLDEDMNFGNKVESILSEIIENEIEMATSTITCMEYLTYPYKMGNTEKINAFFDFVKDCDIPLYSIGEEVAKKAAQIRAEYKVFKAMDALQLATACLTGCDLFLTNDKQLRQFGEIMCITVEELE